MISPVPPYTRLYAAVARRSPTGRLRRGWMPPMYTGVVCRILQYSSHVLTGRCFAAAALAQRLLLNGAGQRKRPAGIVLGEFHAPFLLAWPTGCSYVLVLQR